MEVRDRRIDQPASERHFVLLLHLFLVSDGVFQPVEPQLEAASFRLLPQDGKDPVDLWHGRIGDGDGKPGAVRLGQDAVASFLREPRLGEGGARGVDGEGPGDDGWIAEGDVAFVEGVEPLVVAAEHHVDDFLPVHRMVDADADVQVVERGLADIQIEPARHLGVFVIEGDALDVAVVNRGDLGFFIPQLGLGEEKRVEFAGPEQFERLGFVAHHGVDELVRVETVSVVFAVFRPPVLHAGLGDGRAFDDVLGQHFIRSGGGRETPLVALVVVGAVFGIEMGRRGGDRPGDGRRVDFRLGQRDGHGELVIHRDLGDVFAVKLF